MIANFSVLSTIQIFAHNAMLEVEYDKCVDSKISDSMYEMWYVLVKNSTCRHIPNEVNTIKYYFEDNPDTGDSWANISDAEEIKTAYANSMKKWNNVYFYSYISDGTIRRHKIINVVEGTASDHNLSIYPGVDEHNIAVTAPSSVANEIESGEIDHLHYSEWIMIVFVNHFRESITHSASAVNKIKEKTGAHELGHVLGLRDVDYNNLCGANATEAHHYELLMGYGDEIVNRCSDITYKDIAGVAITRGFHTDDDHKWLNCGLQSDGKYKLVCSICNGVKFEESLSGYSYITYGSCAGNHSLGTGNMMAVASYGAKDYYKCKYCRYVAPFSSIVAQDYSVSNNSHPYHMYVNNVSGLEYTFYASNTLYYSMHSSLQHKVQCDLCEYIEYQPHIYASNATIKMCLRCGQLAGSGGVLLDSVGEVIYLTDSGSYLRPDGIIMLSDEDVELLLAGELDIDALIRQATNATE